MEDLSLLVHQLVAGGISVHILHVRDFCLLFIILHWCFLSVDKRRRRKKRRRRILLSGLQANLFAPPLLSLHGQTFVSSLCSKQLQWTSNW